MESRESWIGQFVSCVAKVAPTVPSDCVTQAADEMYGRLGRFVPLTPRQHADRAEARRRLEDTLREVVSALRAYDSDGNLLVRVHQTGDSVAILKIDDRDAGELASMLRSVPR